MKRTAKGRALDIEAQYIGQGSHETWLQQVNLYTGDGHKKLYITSKEQAQELIGILQEWIDATPQEFAKEWLNPGND